MTRLRALAAALGNAPAGNQPTTPEKTGLMGSGPPATPTPTATHGHPHPHPHPHGHGHGRRKLSHRRQTTGPAGDTPGHIPSQASRPDGN
jgi:hypothetical protein